MKKKLVLLGGGHAHLHLLKSFGEKVLEPIEGVNVTLISPFARQVYSGMLPGWVAGHYTVEQCVVALAPLAARAGVHFHQTSATGIDFARSVIHCADGQEVPFDLLSIDTGPVVDVSTLAGAAAHAIAIRPIESFIESYARLASEVEGRFVRGNRTRVAFVGSGAAGVELALAMQYKYRNHNVGVTLISAADTLPGNTGPRLVRLMRKRGLAVLAGQAAIGVTQEGVQLASGAMVEADFVITAIGASAAAWPRESGLKTDEQGFILINDQLQSISHPNVFATGDCAAMENTVRPKSGVYAVKAGPPLDENLRRALRGEALKPYVPQTRALYLLSAGNKYAVASWGNWVCEGWWVWWWKDAVDRGFVAKYSVAGS
jgi:pyridine nucleotide-disulfide oxidoreductase family protein